MQIPVLRSRGYRVIAPDLRGAGATDKPQAPETYALRSMVADVAGRPLYCYPSTDDNCDLCMLIFTC